jgi:hypothetical protein
LGPAGCGGGGGARDDVGGSGRVWGPQGRPEAGPRLRRRGACGSASERAAGAAGPAAPPPPPSPLPRGVPPLHVLQLVVHVPVRQDAAGDVQRQPPPQPRRRRRPQVERPEGLVAAHYGGPVGGVALDAQVDAVEGARACAGRARGGGGGRERAGRSLSCAARRRPVGPDERRRAKPHRAAATGAPRSRASAGARGGTPGVRGRIAFIPPGRAIPSATPVARMPETTRSARASSAGAKRRPRATCRGVVGAGTLGGQWFEGFKVQTSAIPRSTAAPTSAASGSSRVEIVKSEQGMSSTSGGKSLKSRGAAAQD